MIRQLSRRFWIAIYLIACMAAAFVFRIIPAFFINDSGFLTIYDTDTWYALRQIQLMVSQYPQYTWFDPMTAYPYGKTIGWGPLHAFIAASLCLILGATTQSQIIFTAGWISPVIATLMVPVMYYLAKTVWDERTGLVAAGLITVLSFRFFFLSTYGYVDHHILEIFLSTLFLLTCAFFISRAKAMQPDLHTISTLKIPVALALLAGILFFCAIITSTTVLLIIPVIVFYTFVQMVLDYLATRESTALLILNATSFSLVALLLILFGIDWSSYSFTGYSLGLVVIILSVGIGTLLLWGFAKVFHGKRLFYASAIIVLTVIITGLVYYHPLFRSISATAQQLLFGSSAFTTVVQETQPWSVSTAWANFNISIILMIIGLFILAYYGYKKRTPEHLFFLIWSLVMLLVTVQYRRFEYYSTINIVILAAICITEPFRGAGNDCKHLFLPVTSMIQTEKKLNEGIHEELIGEKKKAGAPVRQKKKSKNPPKTIQRSPILLKQGLCLLMIVLTILMVTISALQDYDYARSAPSRQIPADWIESLAWLQQNTTPPGIDYYRIYDPKSFSYPDGSYGILASWEAGHWITFFAHRIPITNPFQDNLAGKSGAAAYFLSENESAGNAILRSHGGKFVITDSDTAIEMFTSLVPWQNNSVDSTPYIKWFLIPSADDTSVLLRKNEYDDAYFQTLVVRLHNFDGSLTIPETVNYIQYTVRQVPAAGESADMSGMAPVIIREVPLNASIAIEEVLAFNRKATSNVHAIALSDMPDKPIQTVPALQHYRLVHESQNNAIVSIFPKSNLVTLPEIKAVKVFEYVPGAQINGTGIIEVPIKTNTGRTFVYRQASENGIFIVPYPTSGSPYEVGATGPYHIVGTERYIRVTDDDVMQGNRIMT